MKTTHYILIAALAAFLAPHSQAQFIDFHFGPDTQTGGAAMGSAGDMWNAVDTTNGGPVLLKNSTGAATTVSASWTSSDAWAVTKPISSTSGGTAKDAATTALMGAHAISYSYAAGATNLKLSLSGLAPSQAYTLVLYGAGEEKNEGTMFTVSGSATYAGATTGTDRKISSGPGDAYVIVQVVSSATGTLNVTTAKNGYSYAVMNGFQLQLGKAAVAATVSSTAASAMVTVSTTPAIPVAPNLFCGPLPMAATTASSTTSSTSTGGSSSEMTPLIWGICGHPTWSDYASWVPANVDTQMSDINKLGCTYYRVSFEGASGPSYLNTLVPKAQAAGITLLPDLPVHFIAADTAQTNYSNNYTVAYTWASYAISQGYAMPYWELGNEVENWGLVKVVGDGASASDFPDQVPGGFVAIASGMDGAYQGIQDAYEAGRASGQTTLMPQVLLGMCFRHWGLLAKIQAYNNGVLPCDVISWHWYGPNYGGFNAPINDPQSIANGRTPAACLGDFKSKTNASQPMDVWITETNRSQAITGGGLLNGSVASNATPQTSQDWAAEASAVQANIDSFKDVPSVKAIFVYELFDEPKADNATVQLLAGQGYFGLITGLNGTLKNAFYTYQAEIKAGR